MSAIIKLKQVPAQFECKQCGKCCTMLNDGAPIYICDVERIAKYLQLSTQDFLNQYCRITFHKIDLPDGSCAIPALFVKTIGRTCVFYRPNQRACSIHEVKPYICLAAPFISLLVNNDRKITYLEEHCEGFGTGPEVSYAEIEDRLKLEHLLEEEDYLRYCESFADKLIQLYEEEKNGDSRTRTG